MTFHSKLQPNDSICLRPLFQIFKKSRADPFPLILVQYTHNNICSMKISMKLSPLCPEIPHYFIVYLCNL